MKDMLKTAIAVLIILFIGITCSNGQEASSDHRLASRDINFPEMMEE